MLLGRLSVTMNRAFYECAYSSSCVLPSLQVIVS